MEGFELHFHSPMGNVNNHNWSLLHFLCFRAEMEGFELHFHSPWGMKIIVATSF